MVKLNEASVAWAIRSVLKDFDTYIFPMPFEYEAIASEKKCIIEYIKHLDVYNEGIRDYRTSLSPKSTKGFRVATQLDPIDTLISLGLIYEIADDIERARMPKSARRVYSYRLKPEGDGTLYDPEYGWGAYRDRCSEIAESGLYHYVIVTDIADFYPSLYLHDIETQLSECLRASGRGGHGKVLINYVKAMHLNQTHKGLPVGPQFSRPVSELVLDSIDRSLVDGDVEFVRYVDDYVIFSESKGQAYQTLSYLAQSLYDQRGLKLNDQKTEILPLAAYRSKYLREEDDFQQDSILDSFNELLDDLGVDRNPYETIEPDDLDEGQWERLRSFNLRAVLEKEIEKDEPDAFVVSFVISNLARIDDTGIVDVILSDDSIVKLFPRLRTFINYLERVRDFSSDKKHEIGMRVLDLVDDSYVSVLSFNRMWFMNLFTKSAEWNNAGRFQAVYDKYSDHHTRRESLLARGRAHDVEFFRREKYDNLDTNTWLRRAFLAAVSCLPEDERTPWYRARALRSRDILDRIVEDWAQKNHF